MFSAVLTRSLVAALLFSSPLQAHSSGLFPAPDISTAADSVVSFNEVQYFPPGDGLNEWVELYNQMSVDIDLSGWRIEGGIDYKFPPDTTLPAGSYIVVAANPSALSVPALGPLTGRLANNGERLRLLNNNGRLMDELSYSDQPPWPPGADGSGGSLSKVARFAASSPAANWRVSARVGGTPGRPNFPEEDIPPGEQVLVRPGSTARILVPNQALAAEWTASGFDDSGWQEGNAAVGFTSGNTHSATVPVARAYFFEGNYNDSSGNNLHLQNNGAALSSPDPERTMAAEFGGSTQHIRLQDNFDPSAYTIALWVKVRQVRECSLLLRTSDNGQNTSWSHQLRINSAGRFEHYTFDGGQRTVAASTVIQPNVWYHVAATAVNNGPMRLFVNGVPSAQTVSIGQLWTGGNQWRFGTDSGHSDHYLNGFMDTVGIWHSVLADSDIAALASGVLPTGLFGYSGFIETDLESAMHNINSSALLRVPFIVPDGAAFDQLTLRAQFDDGFVAWLNGVEIARRSAPQPLNWNSTATTRHDPAQGPLSETIDLTAALPHLTPGQNILSVQALNSAPSDTDFLFHPELTAREAPLNELAAGLAIDEVSPPAAESPFVELLNRAPHPINLEGIHLRNSQGGSQLLPAGLLQPGERVVIEPANPSLLPGDRLFLMSPSQGILDALRITAAGQARDSSGDWAIPAAPTPGLPNAFAFHDEILINEIMYHFPDRYAPGSNSNPSEIDEQWIELFNRSETPVDLAGWSLAGGISWQFPPQTTIAPGEHLLIAGDAVALRAKYPDLRILGSFSGNLSRRGDRILLLDGNGNTADEVNYFDGAPWPDYADGGGSTLELRDPRADNSLPEAWSASDESGKSHWRRYSYRATAVTPPYSPDTSFFTEFRMGLLNEGEALVDNITVLELPTSGSPRNLLQNTNFSNGSAAWRLLGNHSGSHVQPASENDSNPVLRLVSRGSMSYLDNRIETTLKVDGAYVPVVAGRDYEFSFDARWIAGSPQLHSELYYNKVTVTHILDMPDRLGTPGARNSTAVENAGPGFSHVIHSPAVPASGQPIEIRARIHDPDEVGAVTLRYSVNGGSWAARTMLPAGNGDYSGTIPAQSGQPVIQFYLEGMDALGGRSFYPAAGPESRALIKVENPVSGRSLQTFRIVMKPQDASLMHSFVNLMSDDPLGCTVIHNEQEIFYDARIRLHGSMYSRDSASTTGFTVKFPADHLFRGTRASIVVRRSGMTESFLKHLLNKAGGLPANYDDIVHLVSHQPSNAGAARLNLALYDDTYVDSQFPGDDDGTIFKFEGIRIYQATDNGTPEGRKLPHPVSFAYSYDLTNLGDDPEQYRWSIMIGSQRSRDDYSRIVNMAQSFSLSGLTLQNAIGAAIDVDEWARLFAIQNLFGIGDIYGVDNPHNVAFYVRPSDGRVLALQNDWGFPFSLSSSGSIFGTDNIFKVLNLPIYRRLYLGHLHHLTTAIGNQAYLSHWAQHWGAVTGESYSSAPPYLAARGNSIRSQLPPAIPFEITSNSGNDIETSLPAISLQGNGWINVRNIRLESDSRLLEVRWLDGQRWQALIPLQPGDNSVQLSALDYDGQVVGEDSINIYTTAAGASPRDFLRITELMYHPSNPTAEEAAAGFSDKNDFEFVELANLGPTDLSLDAVRFTFGIAFDFSGSAIATLEPGQRLLIVKNRAAFEARYGAGRPIAGEYSGQLDNAGETIRLVDQYGSIIQELSYEDSNPWPGPADGDGYSLEVIDLDGDYSDPANYRSSLRLGGTPGTAPSTAPATLSIESSAGEVRITFVAEPGQGYTIHHTEDLSSRVWSTLMTIPAEPLPRTHIVTDFLNPQAPARFYRVTAP